MILQVWNALERQLEGKLELMLALQSRTWSSEGHLGALGEQFEGPSGVQVALGGQFGGPSGVQVALGVRLGAPSWVHKASKLRLECGLEGVLESKRRSRAIWT